MCVSSIEVLHDGILYLVPVVMETWGKDVPDGSLRYFSEVADSRYPTVDVGVANTETGRHRMYSKAALLIIIMIHRTIMYNYTYVGHCGKCLQSLSSLSPMRAFSTTPGLSLLMMIPC